ncbi:EAL domain-containing protein [Paucibacter sp. JuS9]|uniref:EAL domain-containing protein n=1 Tax=Roseateles TaxID=93681 RepID=UPI002FE67150
MTPSTGLEAALAEQILRRLGSVMLVLFGPDGRLVHCNDLAEQQLGRELLNLPDLRSVLPEGMSSRLEAMLQAERDVQDWHSELVHKGRRTRWYFQRLDDSRGVAHLLCSGVDVSAERQAQKQAQAQNDALRELLNHDELTGLLSRHALREELLGWVAHAETFGLLSLKLVDFGLLRDNFGPEGADQVLIETAAALRALLAPGQLLAREGGDEFSIAVPTAHGDNSELQRLGRSILNRFKTPLQLASTEVNASIAIGAVSYPAHGASLEELLRNASTALHSALESPGSHLTVYEPRLLLRARERLWLDHHLRRALDLHQLELHYQPKVALAGEVATSVEALLRWRHPKRGLIRPDLFIARAEKNGQIVAMGRWVIVNAAAQAAQWLAQGLRVRIAINISARQLSDPELPRWLAECQRIAHGLLDVELTESCVIEDEGRAEGFMQECRLLGCQVFLDDFGTGFSSLAQLARLPLDSIKLDRSFINTGGERGQALIRSLVTAARELQLKVIAEGVETEVQARWLLEMKVDEAQGWLYAPALPAPEYQAWLAAHNAKKD